MIPISLPFSRAVRIESTRRSARCFHQVVSHSWVRKTQSEVLARSSAFHSSWSCSKPSTVWIRSTIMDSDQAKPGYTWFHFRHHTELHGVQQAGAPLVSKKKQPLV